MNMNPSVHIASTWRDPIGPMLTNARIRRYMLEGWYGPVVKAKAERSIAPSAIVNRCACGTIATRYARFAYLPKAGFYCAKCIALYRTQRDAEKEKSRQLRERILAEYQ